MTKATETLIEHSEQIAQHRSTESSSDLYYSETTLYKHRDGRHFLYHRGGAAITDRGVCWITDDEASQFADDNTYDAVTGQPMTNQKVLDKCTFGGSWDNNLLRNDFNFREVEIYRHENGQFYLLEGRYLKRIGRDAAHHFFTCCASDSITGYTFTDADFDDFVAGRETDKEIRQQRTRDQGRSPVSP